MPRSRTTRAAVFAAGVALLPLAGCAAPQPGPAGPSPVVAADHRPVSAPSAADSSAAGRCTEPFRAAATRNQADRAGTPSRELSVTTTQGAADHRFTAGSGGLPASTPIVAMIAVGRFEDFGARVPSGAALPRGPVYFEFCRTSDGSITASGILQAAPDLTGLGAVRTLRAPRR